MDDKFWDIPDHLINVNIPNKHQKVAHVKSHVPPRIELKKRPGYREDLTKRPRMLKQAGEQS